MTGTVIHHDLEGLGDGRQTCGTAGTRVALSATPLMASYLFVTAMTTNTTPVVIGGSTVVASSATQQGLPLQPGETVEFALDNVADVFLDAVTNGEGVVFMYLRRRNP